MSFISVVTPTFNEGENIRELCSEVEKIFQKLNVKYEHIIIDNNSADKTVQEVKEIIKKNNSVKLIVNNKNYGQLASPVHAIKRASGDAVILINATDFQDPPELIPNYNTVLERWTQKLHYYKKRTLKKKSAIEYFEKIFLLVFEQNFKSKAYTGKYDRIRNN